MPKLNTATIGKMEAKVTMPKPDNWPLLLPPELATPMPSANTRGTVTGPVVTAPQSQAKPTMVASSGSMAQ